MHSYIGHERHVHVIFHTWLLNQTNWKKALKEENESEVLCSQFFNHTSSVICYQASLSSPLASHFVLLLLVCHSSCVNVACTVTVVNEFPITNLPLAMWIFRHGSGTTRNEMPKTFSIFLWVSILWFVHILRPSPRVVNSKSGDPWFGSYCLKSGGRTEGFHPSRASGIPDSSGSFACLISSLSLFLMKSVEANWCSWIMFPLLLLSSPASESKITSFDSRISRSSLLGQKSRRLSSGEPC